MARGPARILAKVYRNRLRALNRALKQGMIDAAKGVYRSSLRHVRGGKEDAPGSYPVPVRTGHLRRSMFWRVPRRTLAIVGNRAVYAEAIHEGLRSSSPHGRRPFLDDGVRDTDLLSILGKPVTKAVMEP